MTLAVKQPSEEFKDEFTPIEQYFPSNFQVYEYSASEDRIFKEIPLSDAKDWFRRKENSQFICQCLLCRQEMPFCLAFRTGMHWTNRSHLFSQKHIGNVKRAANCIGLLFNCSKKFIICLKENFDNGMVFEAMSSVTRVKDKPLKNPAILNLVNCAAYKFYTFDTNTQKLEEFERNDDLVLFMQLCVRPLFKFYCLFCNVHGKTYSFVVHHLRSKKHVHKVGVTKGVILAVREFNIFVTLDFDKLSSFIFLNHSNSYLQELVFASDGAIVISGTYSKKGKEKPVHGAVSLSVNSVRVPSGLEINSSIRIQTRFHNFINTPEQNIDNALSKLNIPEQRNVTIYEFSDKNFNEYFLDNLLYAKFCDHCRMWCMRCKHAIYSLADLQMHLKSQDHTIRVRGNEQIGFMCHFCNIFFIELKGESFSHIHSSKDNKDIIKKLETNQNKFLEYDSPLNNIIIKTYQSLFDNVSESFKFCCLVCYNLGKQKLMYLPKHETSTRHSNINEKCLFTFCQDCNVIYIDEGYRNLKEHFSTHCNLFGTHNVYDINGEPAAYLTSDILSLEMSHLSVEENGVQISKFSSQMIHPGITHKEFNGKFNFMKYLNNVNYNTYQLSYVCLDCPFNENTQSEFVDHISKNKKHILISRQRTSYVKICDVCHQIILCTDLNNLQEHFLSNKHLIALSTKTGTTFNNTNKEYQVSDECKALFFSEMNLNNFINNHLKEMKNTCVESNSIFEIVKNDILKILSRKFPSVTVRLYGSRITGLARSKSDFDIMLNLEKEDFEVVKNLFEKARDRFEICEWFNESIQLIRMVHSSTGHECDIQLVENLNHIVTSNIIRVLLSIDEKLMWLMAAVRYWAEINNLKSTKTFSSASIMWFMLFYLMQPDVRMIPHVSLITDAIAKNESIVWSEKESAQLTKSRFELLEGFFHYYSLIDFTQVMLVPLTGLVIPRDPSDLPMSMQCPVNNERNLLFNSSDKNSDRFRIICYQSLHLPWRLQ